MLRNTVEVVTGVCENTAEAMADLASTLTVVRGAADAMGVDLFGAGTHPVRAVECAAAHRQSAL
ncbi:Glutamate--cysteine ligase [Tsukamurella paurometabola]